ncbi:MAG: homocysteine S-methyltransferase family protein, partial [Lachnospiraceae bacterium]|nr:homocysteine S-methyltransferase family protein [Lachnospiraceae bacterium]
MTIREYMKDNLVILDGGMGTMLQKRGLKPGEFPERFNLRHPEIVTDIHRQYYDAGSNIVSSNTFGANSLKYEIKELSEVVCAAIENVKRAREESKAPQVKFIALDIGSVGRLLKPYGDLDFEDAVRAYSDTVRIGVREGVDLIFIETMNDSLDTKAAVIAAKENSDLPVFVSNAYGGDGKLMTGASPSVMTAMLEGLRVDAIGANCSLGPKQLKSVVEEYLRVSSLPVILKPNAGLPRTEEGRTVYDVFPEEFSDDIADYVRQGVRIFGGCCGTEPDYIKKVAQKTRGLKPVKVTDKGLSVVSSYSHAVFFGKQPVLIGERINPTGKKRFKEALRQQDIGYIISEGIKQEENGAHILDVNVGIPDIDEISMLKKVCFELQAVSGLPLQIDTSDPDAMEAALRQYNGKAMINSVSGKEQVMRDIFPLVKKYGGLLVCLTLDDDGIPDDAGKRVEIAKKIIKTAAEYGIDKKDLIFDTLAMSVSADTSAALSTIEALRRIRTELSCLTSLGVSNVSFGLPRREVITATFFTLALANGLSAAIMNPNSREMMQAYYSFRTLQGLDENCADYIGNIDRYAVREAVPAGNGQTLGRDTAENKKGNGENDKEELTELQKAIVKGLKAEASEIAERLLSSEEPLSIVNGQIIPALDIVGKGFEKNTIYLPQLLMSAEASKAAFERIKAKIKDGPGEKASKGKFVIATVHGDIHDIGKNIVKLLLENYGFEVIDLGKDVPAEDIVNAVIKENAPLAGLSALMTTTVPAMEETIRLLREKAPWVKIIVGGAVMTQEYADRIGADCYAADAMATVRYSLEVAEA